MTSLWQHPEIARELGVEIGGTGIGRHNSLAQYLARELSRQIGLDGGHHTSSLTGSGLPLSMFRLREALTRPSGC